MELNLRKWLEEHPMTVATNAIAVVMWLTTIGIAIALGRDLVGSLVNILLCLVGTTVGWWFGYVGSPLTPGEKKDFGTLAKSVALFLSGFLLSHIEKILDRTLDPAVALTSPGGPRILLVTTTCFISVLLVFSNRREARLRNDMPGTDLRTAPNPAPPADA